tara:strand:+ start:108 stop:347 length:240 start_codon:yes stop_codon:yes gene_type:complete
MKEFIIAGIVCFIPVSDIQNKNCLQFWQDPPVRFETFKSCQKEAVYLSENFQKEYEKMGLFIETLEIYCVARPIVDKST